MEKNESEALAVKSSKCHSVRQHSRVAPPHQTISMLLRRATVLTGKKAKQRLKTSVRTLPEKNRRPKRPARAPAAGLCLRKHPPQALAGGLAPFALSVPLAPCAWMGVHLTPQFCVRLHLTPLTLVSIPACCRPPRRATTVNDLLFFYTKT